MTKTELQAIESRMTEEEIMNRARTLRPVGELKDKGGKRFWLQADRIATEAYLWDPTPLCPTGILRWMSVSISVHIPRLRLF